MAYDQANFAPAGNQSKPISGVASATIKGAPSIYSYATADTLATLNTSGYFNDLSDTLNVGDFIFALTGAGSGGTLAPAICVVLSNAAGVVDVSDGTAITVSDTD